MTFVSHYVIFVTNTNTDPLIPPTICQPICPIYHRGSKYYPACHSFIDEDFLETLWPCGSTDLTKKRLRNIQRKQKTQILCRGVKSHTSALLQTHMH